MCSSDLDLGAGPRLGLDDRDHLLRHVIEDLYAMLRPRIDYEQAGKLFSLSSLADRASEVLSLEQHLDGTFQARFTSFRPLG